MNAAFEAGQSEIIRRQAAQIRNQLKLIKKQKKEMDRLRKKLREKQIDTESYAI